MAKMMEKKSARILALILALIMIGSVLAYAFRGPSKPEERTVKFDMGDSLKDWLRYIPNSTEYIIYFNYNATNKTLLRLIYNTTAKNLDPYAFYIFKPNYIGMFKQMLIGYPELYLIDLEKKKVYFSYDDKKEYFGYNVKIKSFSGRYYAMTDEIHPVVYGYPDNVLNVLNVIANNGTSIIDEYGNYTSRINGSFDYAIIVTGKTAMSSIQSNGTPIADFYFEGYRMNETNGTQMFEKVVGIHFLGNYFFVKSNETAYYYCKNYEDGFSIAIMDDYNLTKLINTTPEIRSVIIKFGK